MGVQFSMVYRGLPITEGYARTEKLGSVHIVPETEMFATARFYASVDVYSAGGDALPGDVQMSQNVPFPLADANALLASFDAVLLATLQAMPGFKSGAIIVDPPPYIPPQV